MKDAKWICYSHICLTDPCFGFLSYDGTAWALNEEALRQHLCTVADAGANALRLIPYSVWQDHPYGKRGQFSPWAWDDAAKAWDLATLNPEYFAIMRRIFEIANDPGRKGQGGLTVWFAFFDQCQFVKGNWNEFSPWLHNKQGVSGVYDSAAGKYLAAFMRKIIDTAAGLDMGWHLANEATDQRFPDMAYEVMFPVIKEKGLAYNRLGYGGGTSQMAYLGDGKYADKPVMLQDIARERFGRFFGEKNKVLPLREVHGIGNLTGDPERPYGDRIGQALCLWNKPFGDEHTILGDWIGDTDGQKKGDSKTDCDADGARPSAATMGNLATHIWTKVNNAHIAHCPQSPRADVQAETFRAISESYKASPGKGKYPANFGKVKYTAPDPVTTPNPDPTPTPQPDDSGFSWGKLDPVWIGVVLAVILIALSLIF